MRVFVAAITGWPSDPATAKYKVGEQPFNGMNLLGLDAICSSTKNGEATVGLRLKAFVESFGNDGLLLSTCTDDWRPHLKQIGEMVRKGLSQ